MNSDRLVVVALGIGSVIAACAPTARRADPPSPMTVPSEAATPLPRPTASYDSLMARLRRGDLMIDFLSLRLAYAETPQYAPYDFRTEAKNAMRAALTANDCRRALAVADSTLTRNYVDIEAHLVSAECMSRLGDHAKANYHGTIARGLLESMRTYASGRTPDSAIVVISIDEEYAFLAVHGYERTRQAFMTCAGHPCDLIQAVERGTRKERQFYFNVAIPFGSFARGVHKDSTANRP